MWRLFDLPTAMKPMSTYEREYRVSAPLCVGWIRTVVRSDGVRWRWAEDGGDTLSRRSDLSTSPPVSSHVGCPSSSQLEEHYASALLNKRYRCTCLISELMLATKMVSPLWARHKYFTFPSSGSQYPLRSHRRSSTILIRPTPLKLPQKPQTWEKLTNFCKDFRKCSEY